MWGHILRLLLARREDGHYGIKSTGGFAGMAEHKEAVRVSYFLKVVFTTKNKFVLIFDEKGEMV